MDRELLSVEREVVNPAHRLLSPTVNHLHKMLRENDGERASLLRQRIKTECFSIAFPIWKQYLFLKVHKFVFDQEEMLKLLESPYI